MTPEEIVKALRREDWPYMNEAADLIEWQEKLLDTKETEPARDMTWFWEIVDRDGLNNLRSDERVALAELVRAQRELEELKRKMMEDGK